MAHRFRPRLSRQWATWLYTRPIEGIADCDMANSIGGIIFARVDGYGAF